MKVFYVIIAIAIMVSCTNVEKYYFVYADGEWIQVDENPMVDDETVNDLDGSKKPDTDKIIENDIDNPADTENENDEDSFIPDPDEEITQDFDYPEIPDEDMCGNPCILLRDKYNNKLCQEVGGKKIRLYVTHEECRCQTKITFTSTLQSFYFFGYFFPLQADDNDDYMNLGTHQMELLVTISGNTEIFTCN